MSFTETRQCPIVRDYWTDTRVRRRGKGGEEQEEEHEEEREEEEHEEEREEEREEEKWERKTVNNDLYNIFV